MALCKVTEHIEIFRQRRCKSENLQQGEFEEIQEDLRAATGDGRQAHNGANGSGLGHPPGVVDED